MLMNPADYKTGGRRRSRGLKTKTLRRMCKSKGLKTTGKKATLMKRLHMRGGVGSEDVAPAPAENPTAADAALGAPAEFADDAASGSSDAAASGSSGAAAADAAASGSSGAAGAGRRRRRSRRREGGKRRQSRRKITEVALGH
jgi:hypothetical protein